MKIHFNNVSFSYNSMLLTSEPVLKEIKLEIDENESVGVVGPSGSGKTTLVQLFTGLLKPSTGKVTANYVDINQKNFNIDKLRQQIGIVFQFPENQLFEETVFKEIAFAPKNAGISEEELKRCVDDSLAMVGLDSATWAEYSPHQLSEGQKRKIAIASILSMKPEMLILDEPTAGMDSAGIAMIEKLIGILKHHRKTVIVVSHDLAFIARTCSRIISLVDGELAYDGPTRELFERDDLLQKLSISIPRTLRFIRKLYEIGYISNANIYSVEHLIKELGD